MRASSYVIYVDLPDNPDEMLLVHGYTGAFDKVSRRVATYVRSLESNKPPKPLFGVWSPEPRIEGKVERPSDETISVLKQRGYVTELSREAEYDVLKKIADTLHQKNSHGVPNYYFMPTYDCNLRCPYCFQDHMRTNEQFRHLLRSMSTATVDRIFAALPEIEAMHGVDSSQPHSRNIGFFGGEPLLRQNRPVVEYIMQKSLAMGSAKFSAITNGTELDAYEDLLSPQGLSGLQITLDGPPAEHDKRRIYPDQSGSFQKIAEHITMALDKGVVINVRLNLDRINIKQLPELAEVVVANRWHEYSNFGAYTAPIHADNPQTDARTTMDSWELEKALTQLHREVPMTSVFQGPDEGIKAYSRRVFDSPKRVVPSYKESFCGAHTRMYMFDAFADIYACWERTGDAKIRMGRIAEDGKVEMAMPLVNLWRTRTVVSNPVCLNCRYALYCGGGCAVLAVNQTGEYHANHCDGFGSRFRASVAEAFVDHVAGKPVLARAERVAVE